MQNDNNTAWRDETRSLLINRPASLSMNTVCQSVGVSKSWLTAFARGEIENPGVVTVQALNTYLKKHLKKAN